MLWSQGAWAIDWPQEIAAEDGLIVVYQPQPERLDGNTLEGRAAMSLELTGRDEPIFGAFWFSATLDTDRDAGTALIRDVSVTEVRWPESSDAGEQRFTAIVEAAVPSTGFEISLERLSASLDNAEVVNRSLESLNTDPPAIVFRHQLAVLLLYDGPPRFADVDGSDYERVMNTPFAVARDKGSQRVYLSNGSFWYEANDPLGPFTPTRSPPADLERMIDAAATPDADSAAPPTDAARDAPPAIVVATQPTELIASDGEPEFQSLPGGDLLYVQNTETPWLRDLTTGNMYILLSGRWYRARSEAGPWTFVPPDELPQSFANIPPDSDIGGVRASVAGTAEADDAVLDAQIPQTAAIQRSQATLDVEYDGAPSFDEIPGTAVAYAVNTGSQVLRIDSRYYAVDGGVWFTSANATGPWTVADSIPQDEIQQIPPTSPVYNTTHVHIYDSTPEVVYVGYTPGYLWSFPFFGVPVYGTGWHYPPYWGSWYHPRPPTWGFHVGYNPWSGWNFGVSWSNGFFDLGMSWGGGYRGPYRPWNCCGGWYGGGYRPPLVINTGDINIGNSINVGNRVAVSNRIANSNVNVDRTRANLYNRPENLARNADRSAALSNLREARPATSRENNVFADRDGNISRVDGERWQTRESGQWQRDRDIERADITRAAAAGRDRVQSAGGRQNLDLPSRARPSTLQQSRGSSLKRANQSRQRATTLEARRPASFGGGGGARLPAGGAGGRLRR